MTTGQFLDAADSEEITRQMAYDLVEAEDLDPTRKRQPPARPQTPAELRAAIERAFLRPRRG